MFDAGSDSDSKDDGACGADEDEAYAGASIGRGAPQRALISHGQLKLGSPGCLLLRLRSRVLRGVLQVAAAAEHDRVVQQQRCPVDESVAMVAGVPHGFAGDVSAGRWRLLLDCGGMPFVCELHMTSAAAGSTCAAEVDRAAATGSSLNCHQRRQPLPHSPVQQRRTVARMQLQLRRADGAAPDGSEEAEEAGEEEKEAWEAAVMQRLPLRAKTELGRSKGAAKAPPTEARKPTCPPAGASRPGRGSQRATAPRRRHHVRLSRSSGREE
eukprot:PLAT3358.12.p1 GENE.PLAT3358.12~~PLAT3358.12.p1  ORF type:complete len:269 (-),score=62.01 PLAT3358.12:68-874(-)